MKNEFLFSVMIYSCYPHHPSPIVAYKQYFCMCVKWNEGSWYDTAMFGSEKKIPHFLLHVITIILATLSGAW